MSDTGPREEDGDYAREFFDAYERQADEAVLSWERTLGCSTDIDGENCLRHGRYVRTDGVNWRCPEATTMARRELWDLHAAIDSGCTCPAPDNWNGDRTDLEFDPACPVHACRECGAVAREVEVFDEQLGVEEKARPVRVTVLACGHESIVSRSEAAS